MLEDSFPISFLCILKHISIKMQINSLTLFRASHIFFKKDPRCCGPFGKFQDTIKISMLAARVSRPSFRSLWLCWSMFTMFSNKNFSDQKHGFVNLLPSFCLNFYPSISKVCLQNTQVWPMSILGFFDTI